MIDAAKDLEGSTAPLFCLRDQNGEEVCLKDLKGKWTVLYFYPKDNTSGCTLEAKDFTCAVEDFAKEGAQIIGVSPDSEESHLKFIGKHELKLTLLSDPEKVSLEAFGVWKKKSMYGRDFMGVERSTFLIDPDGKIRREWRKVKVEGHVDDVLSELKKSK
ncbi:MAG: peroxiredoxin [Thermoplasmatota archaeon]